MPTDDDGDDDAPGFGHVLPPDDRLWRHPSELGPVDAPETATRTRTAGVWGVAVAAGLLGAAVSLGFVAVVGGLNGKVVERYVTEKVPVSSVSAVSTPASGFVGVSRAIGPAMVRLDVTTPHGAVVGSGVLFRDDGHLVTDAHVVKDATAVQVTLADGRSLPGTVVGSDRWSDVAVVKVDAGTVPVATIGSATDLQVGEMAVSVSAPAGASSQPSVTAGVVSALGKKVTSADGVGLHDMIATDAVGTDSSLGGALCDDTGAVIGLTTSTAPSDDDSKLAYATPIDVVRAVADDIIDTGTARHAWLGVEGSDGDGGARVTKVVDGSPAQQAGITVDDVIASVNGTRIESMTALAIVLRAHHPGDPIALVVTRKGQDVTMTVTLADVNPN